MLEYIAMLDRELLLLINGFNNQVFDIIMVFVSSKLVWAPLYLLLLYIIIVDFRKKSWLVLVIVALVVILADQTSVHLFKNVFQRLRPCYEEDLLGLLNLVKACGGKYGFVSSHAANSFAVASFIILLLRGKHRWIWAIMSIYAILIIYSRVYLGVHYPTDVFVGAILGIVIGVGCYYLFNFLNKRV